jgi:chromosome segregation ATPase
MKILLAIIMLLIALPASAQTYEIDGKNIQNRVQELKETINKRTTEYQRQLHQESDASIDRNKERDLETRKIQLKDHRTDRVRGLIAQIGDKFTLVTERFENIINRFESRLDKFDELDVDTSDTRELLILASNEVDNLKTIISNLDETLQELLAAEVSIEDIRSEVNDVRHAINTTRDSIKNALNSFKTSVKVDTTTTGDDN